MVYAMHSFNQQEHQLSARHGAWLGGWRDREIQAETLPSRCPCANSTWRGPVKVVCFPGKYQARILSESLLTPAEYQKEVNYELVTGKVDSLGAFFSTLCPGRLAVRQVQIHKWIRQK